MRFQIGGAGGGGGISMEVVGFIIVIPLGVLMLFGLWKVLIWLYNILKITCLLLYCVIRYGPRKGWKKWNRMGSKADVDAPDHIPYTAGSGDKGNAGDLDIDINFD